VQTRNQTHQHSQDASEPNHLHLSSATVHTAAPDCASVSEEVVITSPSNNVQSRCLQAWATRKWDQHRLIICACHVPETPSTLTSGRSMPARQRRVRLIGQGKKGAARRFPSTAGFVPRAGVLLARHPQNPKIRGRKWISAPRPLHGETPEKSTASAPRSLRCSRDAADRAGADEACRGCVKPTRGCFRTIASVVRALA
jgi:hypothetical protein